MNVPVDIYFVNGALQDESALGTMMGDMRSSQLRRFKDRLFRERMDVLLCTDIGRREGWPTGRGGGQFPHTSQPAPKARAVVYAQQRQIGAWRSSVPMVARQLNQELLSLSPSLFPK